MEVLAAFHHSSQSRPQYTHTKCGPPEMDPYVDPVYGLPLWTTPNF